MRNRREDAGPVQSVDRAIAILEIIARDGVVGVTDVARELGVHQSTAFRLMASLDRRELITQDSARGKYRLGMGIVRLAAAAGRRLDVVSEGRLVCEALAKEVGETVNISVLSGGDALYVDEVPGPSALSPHNWVGQRIPLHATSDGKVLLAYFPAARPVFPLQRFTEHTITTEEVLDGAIAEVRQRGYATAVNELEIGLTAIAAPVRDASGEVIASLGTSGPSFRIPAERIPEMAAALVAAAADISRRLGWTNRRGGSGTSDET
jgi:DNA-binding IclR family transcriptional regulator